MTVPARPKIHHPYVENLRHVLHAIEESAAFLARDIDTRARFDTVADLVEGFESPAGMELLSIMRKGWMAAMVA